MKRVLKAFLFLIVLLALVYLFGPRASNVVLDPTLPEINASTATIQQFVATKEAEVEGLKPGNASSIIWADSAGQKTDYVLLYLHGFSASAMEGSPVHLNMAKRYGFNLYLPRLYGHGIASEDVFLDMTPEKLLASAKEAVAIAELLGDSVIIMSCSTGGTLSLYLAAHCPSIHSLIAYSPNIDVADKKSNMLVKPWGLQLTRLAFGSKHRTYEASEEMKKYWSNRYRLEGLVSLKSLVNATMTSTTFEAINQPLFLGYYYKNEAEKDEIVSIPRMLEMYEELGTPEPLKRKEAFATVNNHVINSGICSSDVQAVESATYKFCDEILKFQSIN